MLDLNGVVTAIETMLQRVIGEDIELHTVTGASAGYVQADPGQLEQVLMNLVVNARDAMPRGGQLTIETANAELLRRNAGIADVAGADAAGGLGVADGQRYGPRHGRRNAGADLRAVLTRPRSPGKGTGLGLSTVYGIVKQSGGFIFVESEPGRDDVQDLPAAGRRSRRAGRAPPRAVTGPDRRRNDPADGGRSARPHPGPTLLEEMGYRVLAASRADEAQRMAEHHVGPIHLLLTDVVMPGAAVPCWPSV